MNDPVNKPKHYQLLPGVEVINVRDAILDKIDTTCQYTARQVDYWSRSWEYLTRFAEKNGLEDLQKSRWYLDRLIADIQDGKNAAASVRPHPVFGIPPIRHEVMSDDK